MHQLSAKIDFAPFVERYRSGTCRDRVLHDLILQDAEKLGSKLTFVDIGCGKGFDTDIPLQQSLVRAAERYIGIEPDEAVEPGDYITDVRRCLFEDTDLPPASVHVAFSVMVLEHVAQPQRFWEKVYDVLVDGGVCWSMTVDARHWFSRASLWSERLKVKDWYLNFLQGERGKSRYENYPVHYRCNTPDQVKRYTKQFSSVICHNFSRSEQCDAVLPRFTHPFARLWESLGIRRGRPGTLLLIRAVK